MSARREAKEITRDEPQTRAQRQVPPRLTVGSWIGVP
jgi:hypothetical protein